MRADYLFWDSISRKSLKIAASLLPRQTAQQRRQEYSCGRESTVCRQLILFNLYFHLSRKFYPSHVLFRSMVDNWFSSIYILGDVFSGSRVLFGVGLPFFIALYGRLPVSSIRLKFKLHKSLRNETSMAHCGWAAAISCWHVNVCPGAHPLISSNPPPLDILDQHPHVTVCQRSRQ